MSDMPHLVTRTARSQILALDEDERAAVIAAVESLSEENGEPVELPTAPEGTAYFAVQPGENAPVVIYRAVFEGEGEGEGWLVICLISPGDYRDLTELGEFLAGDPSARRLVEMTARALAPHGAGREAWLHEPVSWASFSQYGIKAQPTMAVTGDLHIPESGEHHRRPDRR